MLPAIDSKGGSKQGGSAASSVTGKGDNKTTAASSVTGKGDNKTGSIHSKDTTAVTKSNVQQLTRSEEQFFDVVRMRMTEVQVAAKRVENFARYMWNSKEIRANQEVKTLVNVNIIAPLSKWYFTTRLALLTCQTPDLFRMVQLGCKLWCN
jgi:hypothetical protein